MVLSKSEANTIFFIPLLYPNRVFLLERKVLFLEDDRRTDVSNHCDGQQSDQLNEELDVISVPNSQRIEEGNDCPIVEPIP